MAKAGARARADLSGLGISKQAAAEVVPFEPSVEPAASAGESRALTVRVSGADYRALRDYCIDRERQTGQRFTHQQAITLAIRQLLGRVSP
jgi:hypothetical protein